MMIQTVSVSASGPAFTFLLYENLKNEFGQEGFLLGSITEKETKTITDNDQQQTYNSKIIKVNGVIPCPNVSYFYNGIGKIDDVNLKSFLGDQKSKVIAWYRYKPISSFKLSFREKLIHNQLSQFFSISENLFSVCLLISDCTLNGSTHSFQQTFLRNKNNRYEPLPFHIVNLTDNKNCYKSAENSSSSFQGIINNLKISPKSAQGVAFITQLQQSSQEHMESVIKELAVEEEKLFKLEEEIRELIKSKKVNEKEIISKNQCSSEILCEVGDSIVDGSDDSSIGQVFENVKVIRKMKTKQQKKKNEL